MDFKETVLERMRDLKHRPFGSVTIEGVFGGTPYALFLLADGCEKDAELVALLARWRKKHESWFPAVFRVTVEGTAKWLKNQVIETPDRLLFMIRVSGRYLGHIGLFRFHFDQRKCEIDNIVRGEDGAPGIMGDAIRRMMDWGRSELGLEKYELQTFSDNQKSLKLYGRLGFIVVRRVPLRRVEKEDRIEWVEVPEESLPETGRHNVYMELSGKKG